MDAAAVEAVDVRAGESQQDRGVCDYEELCACFRTPADLRQQCELPLRGQRCLRFVHDVQAVRAQVVLSQRQEALAVGTLVVSGRRVRDVGVFLFFGGDVVKAFSSQEITPFLAPVSF